MSKRLIVNATLAVGVASAGSPALAQVADDSATLEQRFRIEQEFGVGDNLGLQTPSEGTTSLATTRLSYGLESKTRAQELSLAVGAALRFGSIAEGNTTSTGLVDPFVGLRYRRDAANASFSVNGDYRQSDISLAAPLWAFLDQDGIVRPPRDFSNIRGSGEREAYNFDVELETGTQAPFGLRLFAGTAGTNYIDQTDPSLTNYAASDFGLAALFRFDALTTASVDLFYSTYSNENAVDTERETQTLQLGFDREISPISGVSLRFGYTDVDTVETNLLSGLRESVRRSGPSGNVGYYREMPNGMANVDFDLIQNQDGERGTLRFSRSITLPNGGLSANIGLTSFDSTDPRAIGGIEWFREYATSNFNFRLTRDVFVDSNDEDRFTNILIAGYEYDINEQSSLSADLSLSYSEAAPSSEASKRGTLLVVYNRELTQDWSMNTGIEYSVLDEEFSGKADSSAIFFGIGRNFDFRN